MKPRRRRPQSAAALVAIVWPRARPHPSRHELEVWNFSRAARVSGATRVKNTGNPATCAPSTLYRVVWLRPTQDRCLGYVDSPPRARSSVLFLLGRRKRPNPTQMEGDTVKASGYSPSSPRFKGVGVRSPRTLRNLDDPTQPLSQASHGTSLPGLPPHATSSSRRVRKRGL